MANTTTPASIANAMANYFFPKLCACEDFDTFETLLLQDTRKLAANCMRDCIEAFDAELLACIPKGFSVHEYKSRTIITLLGEVTYRRTIFLDKAGCRRALTDELLGIPKKSRLSAGAFLWIAYHASELSYRKTAREFYEISKSYISHVTVMNVVHKEGALLKSHTAAPQHISCPEIFVEVDGMWAHLQSEHHRDVALPRGIYEQARQTKSFELKMACCYAGKYKTSSTKVKRVNCNITCADTSSKDFWNIVWDMICCDYDIEDIKQINLGGDGAMWCNPERLFALLPAHINLSHFLDMFHIMQAICKAFPKGDARDKAQQLIFCGKAKTLAKSCRAIAKKLTDTKRHTKINELARYLEINAASIDPKHPSMGTMEGTIAHVGAARIKGCGRSWSKKGAEAMCLIRCAIACNRPLIAPPKDVYFTKRELDAEAKRLESYSATTVFATIGKGYEPKAQIQTWTLPADVRFKARSGIQY